MMPAQRPGKSKQDYGTPPEFIAAVEKRWGELIVDLAASDGNAKAPYYFTKDENFLIQETIPLLGLCWLNPPFENLGPWMAKCKADAEKGAKIIMLVPASIGSEWFAEHVFGHAPVIAVRPRITFEGCKDPYPKDCMLILWGFHSAPGDMFSIWRWKP